MQFLLFSVLVLLVGILMVPNAFALDTGDFYLTYEPTTMYPTFEDWLKDHKILENHIEDLNYIFQLPYNVEIIILDNSSVHQYPGIDCKKPGNAYYGISKILICYELIEDTAYRFAQHYEREYGQKWTAQEHTQRTWDSVANVIEMTLYHELGHAFIDAYKIKISGKEENVADQFAAYYTLSFVLQDDPENYIGKKLMLDAAFDYYLLAEKYPDLSRVDFADAHDLDQQRFYNLTCYTYGAYPNDPIAEWLINEGHLTKARAEYSCVEDYQQIHSFWNCQPVFQEGVIDEFVLSSCPSSSGDFGWIWILIILSVTGVVITVIYTRKKNNQQPKITCRNCNHLNRSTSKVCAKCGNSVYHIYSRIKTPVKGKDIPKITCRNCNHLNRSTSKVCAKCGTPI